MEESMSEEEAKKLEVQEQEVCNTDYQVTVNNN